MPSTLRALMCSTSAPGKLFSMPNSTPIFFMPHLRGHSEAYKPPLQSDPHLPQVYGRDVKQRSQGRKSQHCERTRLPSRYLVPIHISFTSGSQTDDMKSIRSAHHEKHPQKSKNNGWPIDCAVWISSQRAI